MHDQAQRFGQLIECHGQSRVVVSRH